MEKPSYEQLEHENASLQSEIDRLTAQNKELATTIADLQRRLDDLDRAAHRQAAPFRVPEDRHKKEPGRPGRKPGHKASWRPMPDHIDERVEARLDACPHCGGPVRDVTPVKQYIEEIPVIRAHVTEVITYRGRCPRCGDVCSHHPLQVSEAAGAAAVQLGPRTLGLAAELKHELGLTMRKSCKALQLLGVRVTPGGLAQALQRVGRKMEPAYRQLEEAIRAGPVVYADETSWYVGSPKWWLWVFTTALRALYRVEAGRGQDIVARTLADYRGTLVSDCLASYDPIQCTKHKCYSHHLQAIKRALEQRPDNQILVSMRTLLLTAMSLKGPQPLCPGDPALVLLEHWADSLLTPTHADPVVEHVANRLRKRRQHLFTFLLQPGVDATNNLAERDLRPAVIARKVSCGNKTERGKRAWEILMSIAVTCSKQRRSFVDYVAAAMPLAAGPAPEL